MESPGNLRQIRSGGENVQKKRHIVRLYLTAVVLLSMMFTVYIWQSTKMVEIRLRIKSSEKQIRSIETSNGILRSEISRLHSIPRIEKIAKEMGMIVPGEKNTIFIPLPSRFLKNNGK